MPTQVASTAELKDRTLKVLKGVKDSKERVKHAKEKLDTVQNVCEEDVANQLKTAHEKN